MNDEISMEESFSDLYGYFCGMLVQKEEEGFYGWLFGAIPNLGSVKGSIRLADQNGFSKNLE